MLQGIPMMGKAARVSIGQMVFHGVSYEIDDSSEEDDLTSFEDEGAYHPEPTVYSCRFNLSLVVDYWLSDIIYLYFQSQRKIQYLLFWLHQADAEASFGFNYALIRNARTSQGVRSAARMQVEGVAIGPYDMPFLTYGTDYWSVQEFNPLMNPWNVQNQGAARQADISGYNPGDEYNDEDEGL